MVGVAGLEPAASWSRTKHTTKLCHTPIALLLYRKGGRLSIDCGVFCRCFSKKCGKRTLRSKKVKAVLRAAEHAQRQQGFF